MTALLQSTTPLDPRINVPLFAPNVTSVDISDDERRVTNYLATLLLDPNYQAEMALSGLYYDGLNDVPSLGISVPPELEPLRAIMGWCSAGVDARSERLTVQGFRMPGKTSVDDELQKTWQANNMDAESGLVHDDAQIYGRSFVTVGAIEPDTGEPLITVESPRNMLGSWDARRRELSAAFKTYLDIDPASPTYLRQLATLYTRTSTIQMSQGERGWVVDDRNDRTDQDAQFVPVRMFAHRSTVRNRWGSSAMNASWRNTQDRACRTLVRSEVSGEFFAMMKIVFLGVSEQAFKKKDGTLATAWETFAGRINTLDADENGVLPGVEVIRGDSPDGFIKSLDKEAHIMSGHTGLPPQYHGIYSDGNPASADAIRMSDFRLKTIADRLSVSLGNDWEAVQVMCRKIKGTYTRDDLQMETDWKYTGIPTPNADAITTTTQVQAGMIPPRSDDALAANGWTAVQRKRIAQEWERADGLATLNNRIAGLRPAQPGNQAQPMDGQQPQALAALNSSRTTDGAGAG